MFKALQLLIDKQYHLIVRAILWEILHAIFISAPTGFLLIILWELFKPEPVWSTIYKCLGLMSLMLLLQFFVAARAMSASMEAAYDISMRTRERLGAHLRKLSMGFFKQRDPGDITAVLAQDIGNFEYILNHSLTNIWAAAFGPAMMSLFLWYLDWRLTVALWSAIILGLPLLHLGSQLVERIGKDQIAARNNTGARFLEYMHGIKALKAFNLTGSRFQRLEQAFADLRRESLRVEMVPCPFIVAIMTLLEIGFLGAMALGIWLLLGGSLTPWVLLAFLILGYRFYEPVKLLLVDFAIMRYMMIGVRRIAEVLDTPALSEPEQPVVLPEHLDIRFDHVSFAYLERPVLSDISFYAPVRSMTALVGPSGSGKTTVTSLIARFWEVQSGAITIGGTDIRHMPQDQLFSLISEVFQEVYLFHDSILNNLRIGKPTASEAEIIAAAEAAQCHAFIQALPQGYDTVIGEGGSTLSGGQKQRLSIARALLKDAPIVLLDEATASLDPENEALIQQALNRLVADKTLIVIAHKLSTICQADQILVLEQGQIIQQGTHAALLAQPGLYQHLWQQQQATSGWKLAQKHAFGETRP